MKTLDGKEYNPVAKNVNDYKVGKKVFQVENCVFSTRVVLERTITKIGKIKSVIVDTIKCYYEVEDEFSLPLEMSFYLSDYNVGRRNCSHAYNKVFLTKKALYNHIKR